MPYADKTHIKIPRNNLSDEQVLFLGDIFPTGWQAAVQCDIQRTDTVAIWGCGPVGQMTIRSAAVHVPTRPVVAVVPTRRGPACGLVADRNMSLPAHPAGTDWAFRALPA
jgi:threonine dehydrogenase-like Zn-dependent dehydrogenase